MSVRILTGDCREVLRELPDESVHCVVTSPPYFGQRSYLPDSHADKPHEIGAEASPEIYVTSLVAVFRECRRVLRDDGVLWLNLGDTYAVSGRGGNPASGPYQKQATNAGSIVQGIDLTGASLKPKDLIGIPWMTAFALRSDGWYLRGDHVWGKPNGMPESVGDRPVRGHEIVFLLSKSRHYWYDQGAVRTAPKASTITRLAQDTAAQSGSVRANGGDKTNGRMKAVGNSSLTGSAHGRHELGEALPMRERRDKQRGHSRRHAGFNERWDQMERDDQTAPGANLRSIWWVAPAQFKDSHYAVMPDLVAEICIRSGCPLGGTVLDPFGGAGTTGLVADRLGRSAVLIDLNPNHVELAARRIRNDAGLLAEVSSHPHESRDAAREG